MKKILASCCCTGIVFLAGQAYAAIQDRAEVREFIDQMVSRHGFDNARLTSLFSKVEISTTVLEAISRPAEKLPWYRYRPIFVQDGRISQGVEFWRRHRNDLERAVDEYGVPAEILVAIIGVETRYGRSTGRHRVLDSLATLAFDYPKRSAFFRGELEQFLLLTREQAIDPAAIRGSYAGAMGIPQFISSSYRNFAIDFDGDGMVDIWNNPADAIGSVGNYFKMHGWQPGAGIAVPVNIKGEDYQGILSEDLKPAIPVRELGRVGVVYDSGIDPDVLVTLLDLETSDGREHWLGFENFYVITRYNHSMLYAMAVYQLAQEIRLGFEATAAAR